MTQCPPPLPPSRRFLRALFPLRGIPGALMLLAMLQMLLAGSAQATVRIGSLRCENRVDPEGIDVTHPRLSWAMEATTRNQGQTAYRILVASDEAILRRNEGDLWDSGKVASDQSIGIRYGGPAVPSHTPIFWKVCVWDRRGDPTWSKVARWSTGVLRLEDWKAAWIGLDHPEKTNWLSGTDWIWFPEGEPEKSAPVADRFFRRTFTLPEDRPVNRAVLLLAADSECRAYVNDYEVGTSRGYRSTRVVDITAHLKPGQNVIALLGNNRGSKPKPAAVTARIDIRFERGDPMRLATDEQWRARDKDEAGWTTLDFDDTAWRNAKKLGPVGRDPWKNVRAPESRELPARYLRREFKVDKRIRRATVYACGLGLSELYLNGKKIGDHVLSPALAEYPKRVFYVTHDVTDQVRRGDNVIGAILGNGRYYSPRSRIFSGMTTYGAPKLLLHLRIEHTDETVTQIVTDSSWRLTENGPIVANNEYDGEEYDARKEMPGWSEPRFDDSRWQPVMIVAPPTGSISAQMIAPIRVKQTLRPVAVTEPRPGVFVFDLGQNIVGWCRLKVNGPASTRVTLRHAETLQTNGMLYIANLRTAHATDVYTLKGGGPEEWEPRFVYHGFRYVEVTGYPGRPGLDAIEGRVVHDDLASTGDFISSNPLLNQIHDNAVWGVRGNYRSIPTDCPQRDERQGWLGDRSEVSRGESFVFDTQAFYEKWLQDIADAQKTNGSVPDVAPTFWQISSDSVTWPSTSVILPGVLYDQYHDRAIVERHYDSSAQWVNYMVRTHYTNGLISRDRYGDWCVPPEDPSLIHSKDSARKTDGALLATAFFYHDLRLMQRYATLLELPRDAERFGKLADQVKTAFNQRFFRRDVGYYDNGTQTSCVLPLAFGLVPENFRAGVFTQLVNKIEEARGHIGTGVLGGMHLMRVLTENGRPDLAFAIATQHDYPGWGYMVENGATTIWELWNGNTADPAMNSGNHVMLIGDLITWMYQHLAGIASDPEQPGFRHVVMRPEPVGDLKSVRASHRSPYGWIRSEWRKTDGQFTWKIEVPPNSSATVFIPATSVESVLENRLPAAKTPGVKSARFENGRAVLEIGSGKYQFVSK